MELAEVTRRIYDNSFVALDYGCGTGNVSRILLGYNYVVTGVDISSDMLSKASARLHSYITAKRLKLTEASDPTTLDGEFSLVVLYSVLHHLPDPVQYLSTLADLVKPGGALVIDHESIHSRNHRLYRLYSLIDTFLRRATIFPYKPPPLDYKFSDYFEGKIPWPQLDLIMSQKGFITFERKYLASSTTIPNPLIFFSRRIFSDTIAKMYFRKLS